MPEFTTEIKVTSSVFDALSAQAQALSEKRQHTLSPEMVANELLAGLLLNPEPQAPSVQSPVEPAPGPTSGPPPGPPPEPMTFDMSQL